MGRSLTRWLGCAFVAVAAGFSSSVQAAGPTHIFALIVANNRSVNLSQPDLMYADDDGARYYQLFRSIAAAEDVALLTTFDRSSAAEYPELGPIAVSPTKRALSAASARIAVKAAAAQARGERVELYFVFAGHGDVDKGRGYLELADASIDGAFLEREIIDRVPAQAKHLLLDSCNSFFVVNPRKPGGRRWATPKDMALGFSARHPEVGLFLSTNSDSEVFEWSELESGVFSHEVRSGVSGAADVNGDGATSYSELAGFVENANAGIPREGLRPHLFYRGPHGNGSAPLFPTASIAGRRVALSTEPSRLWIKNATGSRFIDVHKERGAMTLFVPGGVDQELSIYEERAAFGAEARPSVIERTVPAGAELIELASLESASPTVAARGDKLFGALFALPYGPLAYSEYQRKAATAPEPVYGLTEVDLSRMNNYLTMMASQDRSTRSVGGGVTIGLGAIIGSVAVGAALDKDDRRAYPLEIAGAGVLSGALIGSGLYFALTPSTGERALATFQQELAASRGNGGYAFVRTEQFLTEMAARERTARHVGFWTLEGLGLGLIGLATASAIDPPDDEENHYIGPSILYTEGALFSVLGFVLLSTETPTERMLHLYREDPTLKLHFGAVPSKSGLAFGLSGTF